MEKPIYKRYRYSGPVLEFCKPIANNWVGETVSTSKEKAISNLKYQFKMETKRIPSAKIVLPGEVKIVD